MSKETDIALETTLELLAKLVEASATSVEDAARIIREAKTNQQRN